MFIFEQNDGALFDLLGDCKMAFHVDYSSAHGIIHDAVVEVGAQHPAGVIVDLSYRYLFLLDGGLPTMPNIVMPDGRELRVSHAHTALRRGHFVWDDLRWIRELWPGPIVIKGVLTAEDARRAVDEGAAAIVVSNHGGRQLDGAPASLRVLPEIVAAANGQAEVLMDSGIRRGADVVKAICLGARAVLCGRAYAYGLGAAGERGVARALEILRDDLTRTLTLLGCPSVSALDRSYVNVKEV